MTARVTSLSCWLLTILVLSVLTAAACGAEEGVGKVTSPSATLLRRGPDAWTVLEKDAMTPGDSRLLALPGSRGELQIGDLHMSIWGNVPAFDNFPVFESMVTFNPGKELDFTLNRGRVILTRGADAKEPLKVRVRFHQTDYQLTLPAGAKVAFEEFGRWPRGTAFKKNPGPRETPFWIVSLYQLAGTATLKTGGEQHLLRAGTVFNWDSLSGPDGRPMPNDKPPLWVKATPTTPAAGKMRAAVEILRGQLEKEPVAKAVKAALDSKNEELSELAVFSLAALNELEPLVGVLEHADSARLREIAIHALRHWLGQQTDHAAMLYRYLTAKLKYPPVQAEIVLQLLLSFNDNARTRPETYETLIEYLKHDKLAIRELSRSHLYRWVIAGRNIPYDPAGTEVAREKSYQAWKKLIPTGKLPPVSEKP